MTWSTASTGPQGPADGENRESRGARRGDDDADVATVAFRHESGVIISDIQVRPVNNERLRGWATVTFNNVFVIKGIRIIMGNNRLFVAMPSRPQKVCRND